MAALTKVDALLCLAERSISLLDRCRPLNALSEAKRVQELWQQGKPQNPAWIYRYPPKLAQLRRQLADAEKALSGAGELCELYAARARELELEASIAETIGSEALPALAARRFGVHRASALAAKRARAWARLRLASADAVRYASDDVCEPHSLLGQMLAMVARLRLPVSVVIKRDLQSVAAAGDDTLFLRPGVHLTRREARRIVVHELLGHVFPRLNARTASLGLFRVGSAEGADDEEGRALLLEERHGLLGHGRQVELGLRHLAALSVFDGADWVQTVRLLLGYDLELCAAITLASRAHRGGGLAREVVYLSAFERVKSALQAEPWLDNWLSAGRLSVAAARTLARVSPAYVAPNVARVGLVPDLHE